MLVQGKRYYAAAESRTDPASGLPIFAASCGIETVPGLPNELVVFGVAQGKNVSGEPLYAMAKCLDGGTRNGRRVVALPTAKLDAASGLPVYAFVCCPSELQSGSGSGSGSAGSGSGSAFVGVPTGCCPSNPFPQTLFASFSTSTCPNLFPSGSLALTFDTVQQAWIGTYTNTCCGTVTITLHTDCTLSLHCPNQSAGCDVTLNVGVALSCSPISLPYTYHYTFSSTCSCCPTTVPVNITVTS